MQEISNCQDIQRSQACDKCGLYSHRRWFFLRISYALDLQLYNLLIKQNFGVEIILALTLPERKKFFSQIAPSLVVFYTKLPPLTTECMSLIMTALQTRSIVSSGLNINSYLSQPNKLLSLKNFILILNII